METTGANHWKFSMFKGHNSAENGSILPKIRVNLDIIIINLYTKFQMCNISAKKMNENLWWIDQ